MSLLTVVAETGLTARALWGALWELFEEAEPSLRRHLREEPALLLSPKGSEGSFVATPEPSPLSLQDLPLFVAELGPSARITPILERWTADLARAGLPETPLDRGECLAAVAITAVLADQPACQLVITPLPRPRDLGPAAALLNETGVVVAVGLTGVVTAEAIAALHANGGRFVRECLVQPIRIGRGSDGRAEVSVWRSSEPPAGEVALVETNLDDLQPEFYSFLTEQLLQAGALDVWLVPVIMKKGRPGTWLQVLCSPEDALRFAQLLFRETTTLGVRCQSMRRWCLERRMEEVITPFGPVRVKIASGPQGLRKAAPEYEDCRQLAVEKGVPLRDVYEEAMLAVRPLQSQGSTDNERFECDEEADPDQPGYPGDSGCHP